MRRCRQEVLSSSRSAGLCDQVCTRIFAWGSLSPDSVSCLKYPSYSWNWSPLGFQCCVSQLKPHPFWAEVLSLQPSGLCVAIAAAAAPGRTWLRAPSPRLMGPVLYVSCSSHRWRSALSFPLLVGLRVPGMTVLRCASGHWWTGQAWEQMGECSSCPKTEPDLCGGQCLSFLSLGKCYLYGCG